MKIIKYLLISLILLVGINVYADSYIKYNISKGIDINQTVYLYSESQPAGTVDGISYDSSTRTLTLNNYTNPIERSIMKLEFYNMGSINIQVVGVNDMKQNGINQTFYATGTNLNVSGTGTLNLYGVGFQITDSSSLTINDITINGYGLPNGWLVGGGSSLTLNGVTAKYFYYSDGYQHHAFSSGNVRIIGSNIYGIAAPSIEADGDVYIEDSTIKMLVKNIKRDYDVAIGASGNVTIKNSNVEIEGERINENSALASYFDGDLYIRNYSEESYNSQLQSMFADVPYNSAMMAQGDTIGISAGNNVVIDGGNVKINGANKCILTMGNTGMNNTDVELRCPYGILNYGSDKSLTLSSSNLSIKDTALGINNATIIVDENSDFKSEIMNEELQESYVSFGISSFSAATSVNIELDDSRTLYVNGKEYTSNKQNLSASNSIEIKKVNQQGQDPQAPDNQKETIIDVIKNVPNTSIISFVGFTFGVAILVYGTYLVLKACKKETL